MRLIKLLTTLKQGEDLRDASIKITENDGLVLIQRNGIKLTVNSSGRAVRLIARNVVFSNNYADNCLSDNGFVIENNQ